MSEDMVLCPKCFRRYPQSKGCSHCNPTKHTHQRTTKKDKPQQVLELRDAIAELRTYCIENDLARQQELEAIRQARIMRDASYLLPDPAGDVVRQLLDEVDSLKHWLRHYQDRTESLEQQLQQAHRAGWEQAKKEAVEVAEDYEGGKCAMWDAIANMEYKEAESGKPDQL